MNDKKSKILLNEENGKKFGITFNNLTRFVLLIGIFKNDICL
tara:strand:+ start:361 stop:486 length:126 start_codon:yes stop_codon:yes gene_type:complete